MSVTAVMNAAMRAAHIERERPPIFEDPLAAALLTPDERTRYENAMVGSLPFVDPSTAGLDRDAALLRSMREQSGPVIFPRARLVEDLVVREHIPQYVILGAGLDTFAFRSSGVTVFEVDHPKSQADKRMRIERAGWSVPDHLRFVEVDLEGASLVPALVAAGFDSSVRSCIAWMGVTYYLTHDAILSTLERLASICATGSVIAFDHADTAALDDTRADYRMQKTRELVARAGEPMKTGLDPSALASDLVQTGWRVVEQLTPDDIEARYLSAHPAYKARAHFHIAVAQRA